MTQEIQRVAERGHLAPEIIRDEVARGRMIIPANVHPAALDPVAIALKARVKINANIASFPDDIVAGRGGRQAAPRRALGRGHRDGPVDGQAHRPDARGPIGTVPIHEAMAGLALAEDLTIERLLEVIERQARHGVDA